MDLHSRVSELVDRLAPLRARLNSHPLHDSIRSPADVRIFLQHHVFAVWDFMCLLKGLQRTLTCVELPWRPVGTPATRRLINEIVLEEESDLVEGVATGHFELYLGAMREIGADTGPVSLFLEALEGGVALPEALRRAGVPKGAAAFVRSTFEVLDTGEPHRIGSAFTFGREALIPLMFRNIAGAVDGQFGPESILSIYLRRHLELDEADHAPKAIEMLCGLCGDDDRKWSQAASVAEFSLQARLRLWTAISAALSVAQGSADFVEPPTVTDHAICPELA